jgi:hypothetical protein
VLRIALPGIRFRNDADGPAVGTAMERVGVLAVVDVDQVALAERAAGHELDRIHPAHVGLHDRDDLLVLGVGADLTKGDPRHLHAHGQAGTQVTVEPDDVVK